MKTRWGRRIARAGRLPLKLLRMVLYVVLLMLGRVLLPVAGLATSVGIMIFLFCLFLRPEMVTPKWAGLGLAVGATLVSVFYDAALRLVAPRGVVIVSDV